MSKAVKKVTRHVKKVISGVNKLRKKVINSKAFKVIAIAAAVYFTGGAVLGAIKGAAAASATGTSVLAGAGQGALSGIGSAGAGISKAWGNLTQMQFKAAGNSLVGGISNAGSAGANAVTSGAGWGGSLKSGFASTKGLLNPTATTGAVATPAVSSGPPLTSQPMAGSVGQGGGYGADWTNYAANSGGSGASKFATMSSQQLANEAGKLTGAEILEAKKFFDAKLVDSLVTNATGPASKGLLRTLASNPLVPYAGIQLAGSMAQGHAQQQMVEDERDFTQQVINDDRERYNRNIGTLLYT
jgi:hypothetical protein